MITGPTLVRHGREVILDKGGHTRPAVYREMLLQISRDYAGLPDPRTLTESDIRFFYDGLRNELKEYSKPKPGGK